MAVLRVGEGMAGGAFEAEMARRAKSLAARIREGLKLDEITAGRLLYYFVLKKSAESEGVALPFRDERLEELSKRAERLIFEGGLSIGLRNTALLDSLYEVLVPQGYRRRFGQFLTPSRVAELMAELGMEKECSSVLDPAAGPGALLEKVVGRSAVKGKIRISAIDIDPLMLNACALRLRMAGLDEGQVTLVNRDFLGMAFESEQFDLIVCNPPYLDFHDYERGRLADSIYARFGIKVTKLANAYALFFIQASRFASEGGSAVFITPSEFLYTGYGEQLREFLLKKWTVVAFILFDSSKPLFSNAATTSLITFLRKSAPPRGHKVKFIRVTEWPADADSIPEIVRGRGGTPPSCTVREVLQSALNPADNWLSHFQDGRYSECLSRLVPLREIAEVKRGIATGHNKFFTLSRDEVIKRKIETRFLRPAVAKASHCRFYDFTLNDFEGLEKEGQRVYLLYVFEPPSGPLEGYLEYGMKIGVHKRYIPSRRNPWYSVERRAPAPVLATVFSRRNMRFIYNRAGVLNLSPFHGIYPKFSDETMVKALLAYLNSGICGEIQATKRREYGGGLHKFEPGDLEALPVLDVTNLNRERLARLAALYDQLCAAARNSPHEIPRVKALIDSEVEAELGQRAVSKIAAGGQQWAPHLWGSEGE